MVDKKRIPALTAPRRWKMAPARKGWAAVFDDEIDLATIRNSKTECQFAIEKYIIVHDRFTRVIVREIRPARRGK